MCVFVRESEAADAVWKMHVCTRARFKGGERDRAEQHRLVREWELQTERQRRVLESRDRQHKAACLFLSDDSWISPSTAVGLLLLLTTCVLTR